MPETTPRGQRPWRWLPFCVVLGGALACTLAIVSCSSLSGTVMAPPEIPGATFVGNKACAECHVEITRLFPASPHARVHIPGAAMAGQSGCESCHGPGSRHVAMPYSRDKLIVNPRKSADTCFQCHVETHAQFNLPQHHPVLEGKMTCVQCHDPHGLDIMKPARGLAMARRNETCADCHREQTRPVVYEHQAMREGCGVCHQTHGSINAKLLVQRDNNLCLKCHAQVQIPGTSGTLIAIGKKDHTAMLPFGSCWSAGCHSAVHGSQVSPRLYY